MADQLDLATALSLARQLKAIPNFPWDEEVIAAHAQHLMRWCRGQLLITGIWSAEAQATWLVTEVQETWLKWHGTGELFKVFRQKFHAQTAPAGNTFQPLKESDRPPILCATCKDSGIIRPTHAYEYCDCDQGLRMAADPHLGERWLALHNRDPLKERRKTYPAPDFAEQENAFLAHREQVAAQTAEAEAILADDTATRQQKEIAQAVLETYRPKIASKKTKPKRERVPWQI
jgi:hypothetical protein